MQDTKNPLTEGALLKALIAFSTPFLIANLLQAFYGAADLMIVGQFESSPGISAVATGSQIMQTITCVIGGLTTGGTILIGQYIGAKNYKEASKTIGSIIFVFSILSVLLTILMATFITGIVDIMQTPKEAYEYTKQYLFICSLGIPFIVGYNAVSGVLRGMGNSKAALIFIAVACSVNVLFDLILVGIFHMGAMGAALATVFAQAISFLLSVVYLKKKGFAFELNKKYICFDLKRIKRIFGLGLPIAMQDGLINASFLLITAIVNTMGVVASASVGVVEKIIMFAMLPPNSFACAIAVMTAQNIGAKKPHRAKQSLYWGVGISLIFGIIVFLFAQVSPELITRLLTNDAEVIQTSALYFLSFSYDCILVCFVFCLNSFFSGCGYTVFPMVHSLLATFAIRVPVSYLFSKMAGVTLFEMGLAAPLATLFSLILCLIYLRSKKIRIVLKSPNEIREY